MQTTISAGAERRTPDVLRFNQDGTLTVRTIDGHNVRIDGMSLAALRVHHDVSDRWFLQVGTDGRVAVRAFRASDEFAVHPERLVDLLAPPGPDYEYEFIDSNPLNLGTDNFLRVWEWDIPRRIDGKKDRPGRREAIRDTERGLVFVPLAGSAEHATLYEEDFDHLVETLNVSDQWYLNSNGKGLVYVRSHRCTADTRSVLSIANEIMQPGRTHQVKFKDGNRLNLQRTNLAVEPRRGHKMPMEFIGDVHIPDNDRAEQR